MKEKKKLFLEISKFLKSNGASKVKVFGSYARGDETPKSDIDLIVEFDKGITLLGFVKMERELSEKIGIKVDLLTESSISPYLAERIKKEALEI